VPNDSHTGFNQSVEEITSILLILFMLLCIRFSSTMIMSPPGLELIVCIIEEPIKRHRSPGLVVHFFA